MLIACIDVRVLPLQMLLWRRREWEGLPVAVVDRDKPQGLLLWVDETARASRVLPGMRYAAALSLEPQLRASVVDAAEIADGVATLTRCLQDFSPVVEPAVEQPGVFWLDATGILPLYSTHQDWAVRIRVALFGLGFRAQVAVGFSRFATYAAARVAEDVVVFDQPEAEQRHARAIRIDRLDFAPKLCATLHQLGVERLAQFLDLPVKGIRRRLGADAYLLYCLARGDTHQGLQAAPVVEPLQRELILEQPDADLERLLVSVEAMLDELFGQLAAARQCLVSVRLQLQLDDGVVVDETLTPATPTRDQGQLLSLVCLRLQGVRLTSGVTELRVAVQGGRQTDRQLDLFERPARDLDAARRALARLRAEFGDEVVVRACLREGHMPEAQFGWERMEQLQAPRPVGEGRSCLVRRYYPAAVPLALAARQLPIGWQIHPDDGPVEELIGPHVVSGGWWLREVVRDYYYALTCSGRWLWIYRDRRRQRWFMQGEVE